jgi:drug/metabolite transporter (DMT)-like permease
MVPFVFLKKNRRQFKLLNKVIFAKIAIYGIIFITFTQGFMFLSLYYVPAITVSFVLNLTTIMVLFLGVIFLKESPNKVQLIFIIFAIVGVFLFFYPFDFLGISIIGLLFVTLTLIANSLASILGRTINKDSKLSPFIITTISMGFGSLALLTSALLVEGVPSSFSTTIIMYILWLAVVNTAFAFTLWNFSLRHLKAVESTIINSTMLPQIVILALIFLDELPTINGWIAIVIIFISAMMIQIFSQKK